MDTSQDRRQHFYLMSNSEELVNDPNYMVITNRLKTSVPEESRPKLCRYI